MERGRRTGWTRWEVNRKLAQQSWIAGDVERHTTREEKERFEQAKGLYRTTYLYC